MYENYASDSFEDSEGDEETVQLDADFIVHDVPLLKEICCLPIPMIIVLCQI
jgi:hypothetical protein